MIWGSTDYATEAKTKLLDDFVREFGCSGWEVKLEKGWAVITLLGTSRWRDHHADELRVVILADAAREWAKRFDIAWRAP